MTASASSGSASGHWLLKAEPDSRIVKGKDVKFSVEDFERVKTSPWEGVRNHQAKNFLKSQIKLGQSCLFYASNTKIPGVTALCKCVKEGYPDYTAWDPEHPYYDPKSKSDEPTWYMVDVEFTRKLPHMVPLKLLQAIAAAAAAGNKGDEDGLPAYLETKHIEAIKDMPLLNRGRLSVQPVSDLAYDAIVLLGDKGGFDDLLSSVAAASAKKTKGGKGKKRAAKDEQSEEETKPKASTSKGTRQSKRQKK